MLTIYHTSERPTFASCVRARLAGTLLQYRRLERQTRGIHARLKKRKQTDPAATYTEEEQAFLDESKAQLTFFRRFRRPGLLSLHFRKPTSLLM